MINPWILFLLLSGVIVFSGTQLSKYGDILAEKSGLGRTWIGLILMASVTSLPELITGLSSVAVFHVPDIAVGGIIGSCVFNLFILALVDALSGQKPASSQVHQGHLLAASFGIVLIGIACFSIFLGNKNISFGWIGIDSIIILIVYFLAMKSIFSYEKKRMTEVAHEMAEELQYQKFSTKKTIALYIFHSLMIIGAALYLPKVGDQLAASTGLGQSFIGNMLIAFTTSLPEVVVSIAAVKIGALDMAFGNLFGSNLFNIAILAIDDLFYTKGPILVDAASNHIIPGLSAILMSAVAIIALTYRSSKKTLFLGWDAWVIGLVYIVSTYFLYIFR